MKKINIYGGDIAVAKLQNRRILVQKRHDSMMIVFRSLQEATEHQNPYWDKTSEPKCGKCVAEKVVHISNESAHELVNCLLSLEHPNATQIFFNPTKSEKK